MKFNLLDSGSHTISVNKSLSVIDTAERKVTNTLTVESGDGVATRPDGVAVTAGGARLYVTMFGSGFGSYLYVMSALTGDVINVIKTGDGPFAVAATPVPGGSAE
jgi:DNA-binding beta-propeller fold protein YncE